MDNVKLKPCPFCGGTDIEVDEYTVLDSHEKAWKVLCLDCKLGFDTIFQSEQEAVKAWNTRCSKEIIGTDNTKPKPCPFCGGTNIETNSTTTVIGESMVWSVRCVDCNSRYVHLFDDDEEAIESWNDRYEEEDD